MKRVYVATTCIAAQNRVLGSNSRLLITVEAFHIASSTSPITSKALCNFSMPVCLAFATHPHLGRTVELRRPLQQRSRQQQQRRSAIMAPSASAASAAAPSAVWALDFDGVTCDSVGESSLSAFKVGLVAGLLVCWSISNPSRLWAVCHAPMLPTRSLKPAVHVRCMQAAAKLWPEVFQTPEAEARKEELVEKMRVVRPVVETG